MAVLNAAVQRIVTAALWVSPLGVGSLIAASILRACELWGERVGRWGRSNAAAVMSGLPALAGRAVQLASLCIHHPATPLPQAHWRRWVSGRPPCLTAWRILSSHSPARSPPTTGTLAALGLWVATVLAGLALFAGGILPLLLWGATGRSPLAVTRQFAQVGASRGMFFMSNQPSMISATQSQTHVSIKCSTNQPMLQPLLMAFGTSSSAAALPLAMQAAKAGGCDEAVVDFFLPLGTLVGLVVWCGLFVFGASVPQYMYSCHRRH